MKTKTFLFLPALALVLFSCSTPQVTGNKDQALADSLFKSNVAVWSSGNAQKVTDQYTDDCLLIDNTDNSQGRWSKDSVLVFVQSVAPFIKNLKAFPGPARVSGNCVYMDKYFSFDYVTPDFSVYIRGVATMIWLKQPDGSWKIALDKITSAVKH